MKTAIKDTWIPLGARARFEDDAIASMFPDLRSDGAEFVLMPGPNAPRAADGSATVLSKEVLTELFALQLHLESMEVESTVDPGRKFTLKDLCFTQYSNAGCTIRSPTGKPLAEWAGRVVPC